jgi:enamine deaminase RidA (YjgF/YER057c/UK114 family)
MIRACAAAALVLLLPSAAHGGARQSGTAIMPEDPRARQVQEDWGFSDALLIGDTAYLSGLVAGMAEGETTPEAAYERAFQRIGDNLGRVGCSWDDVVEMTSFHTDVATQLPFMVAVKKKYVRAPYPAWTAVGVTRLIPSRGITEIKVVARMCRAPAAAAPSAR